MWEMLKAAGIDPERAENLCELLIFVEDATGSVASSDAESIQIDDSVRQRA